MITFLLEGITVGLWETLTVAEYATVRIFEVLYVVNHLANPFVYAFMDVKFVTEVKKVFSCHTKQSFKNDSTSCTEANETQIT